MAHGWATGQMMRFFVLSGTFTVGILKARAHITYGTYFSNKGTSGKCTMTTILAVSSYSRIIFFLVTQHPSSSVRTEQQRSHLTLFFQKNLEETTFLPITTSLFMLLYNSHDNYYCTYIALHIPPPIHTVFTKSRILPKVTESRPKNI